MVAKKIDDEGGLGFVVERAQPSRLINTGSVFVQTDDDAAMRQAVNELLTRRPYLTRLYTRMSGEEMILDPQFIETDVGDFSGTYDLSTRPELTIEVCPEDGSGAPNMPPRCGTLYCGQGDACALSELGVEGCVCREGRSARAITSPAGVVVPTCMTRDIDVHPETPTGDACAGFDCGEGGQCVPINGSPTCACGDNSVAIVDFNRVRCSIRSGDALEADQLLWPVPEPAQLRGGCHAMRSPGLGGLANFALLIGAIAALREWLRRRAR